MTKELKKYRAFVRDSDYSIEVEAENSDDAFDEAANILGTSLFSLEEIE